MPVKKHIHKLKRHKYKNKSVVFFCTLNCNYKIEPALALGKEVLCSRCESPFILDKYAVRRAEPFCHRCKKHEKIIGEEETPEQIEERREGDRRISEAFNGTAQVIKSELQERMNKLRGNSDAQLAEDDLL